MKTSKPTQGASSRDHIVVWLLVAGCVLVILVAILMPNAAEPGTAEKLRQAEDVSIEPGESGRTDSRRTALRRNRQSASIVPAEQVVAEKLKEFAVNRREVLHRYAAHLGVEPPAEYDEFMALAEAGNWDQIEAAYDRLNASRTNEARMKTWQVVQETYGVAEIAHKWPARALLDYGNEVLSALPPDAVYIGGTDPGRFIPTLLNETSGGQRHVIVTQNALADQTYVDYIGFLYGDRLDAITPADSQTAFTHYTSDAARRLQHDREFPNENAQIRPGENVMMTDDGRIQISGQVAVMGINELILQRLMERNPGMTFAIEQSFPFESTYSDATVTGAIMELGVKDGPNTLTPARADEAVNYWRSTTADLLGDSAVMDSAAARAAYAKLAVNHAGLFVRRNYPNQAEQTFRLAGELCPWMPEVVFQHVQLLVGQGRVDDALSVVNRAIQSAPEGESIAPFQGLADQLKGPKQFHESQAR